jgi:hypothetical protein
VYYGHPAPGTRLEGGCQVTVFGWTKKDGEPDPPTVADPDYHLRYRSQCDGCGDEGPIRSSENAATEDGHDHAFPGWRDMPVLEHRPYEYDGTKARQRWEADARRAYPEGWFERGGPVLEYRTPPGTRHVPGQAPGGGYCMAVVRPAPASAPAAPAAGVQESLFG